MVLPFIGRILRLASIVICAIALIYFAAFALEQTSSASSHQQAELGPGEPASGASGKSKQSGFHEAVDEAMAELASPFSGITSSLKRGWTIHIVNTLLVLIVFGFGLAFLARLLRLGRV